MIPRATPDGGARRRRALLEAYVAPAVVAHVLSDGHVALPSVVRLPVIVLFADICNFTRLAALRVVYHGRPYHFCSTTCRTAFRRDPRTYVVDPPARVARVIQPRQRRREADPTQPFPRGGIDGDARNPA